MSSTLVRRFAVGLALAGIVSPHGVLAQSDAAAEEQKQRVEARLPASSVPPSPDDPMFRYRKREPQPEEDDKADWPTDDFGQPLRGCDVPWDFVPSKR